MVSSSPRSDGRKKNVGDRLRYHEVSSDQSFVLLIHLLATSVNVHSEMCIICSNELHFYFNTSSLFILNTYIQYNTYLKTRPKLLQKCLRLLLLCALGIYFSDDFYNAEISGKILCNHRNSWKSGLFHFYENNV